MYLPSFSAILLVATGLLLGACGRPAGSAPDGAATANALGPAAVVAGTGAVDPQWVEDVRATVAAELPELRTMFDGEPRHEFFVFVHAGRDTLTPALAACLQPESPAFALLGQHQVHVVWNELWRLGVTLRGVVRHELVHELLDQYTAPNGRAMPRWFHEGLAQFVAGDTYLGAREEDIALRLLARRLPGFAELRDHFPADVDDLRIAYAQSFSYVSWLAREYGVNDLLAAARATNELVAFESALARRLGRSTYELEEAWRGYVLHGSGAPWRVLLDQCFSLTLLLLLPLLVLALGRRLAREGRTARALAEAEAREAQRARERQLAAAAAATGEGAGVERAADAPGAEHDDHDVRAEADERDEPRAPDPGEPPRPSPP